MVSGRFCAGRRGDNVNPAAVESRFDTYHDYRQAVADLIALAQERIVLFDPDLQETGLESSAGAASLQRFVGARSGRRLQIVLHRSDHAARHCPRLLSLLRYYGDAIEVRQSPEDLRQLTDCFVLADGRHGVVRFHADHARGKFLVHQEHEIGAWQRRFDDLWELSSPALAATTLGL